MLGTLSASLHALLPLHWLSSLQRKRRGTWLTSVRSTLLRWHVSQSRLARLQWYLTAATVIGSMVQTTYVRRASVCFHTHHLWRRGVVVTARARWPAIVQQGTISPNWRNGVLSSGRTSPQRLLAGLSYNLRRPCSSERHRIACNSLPRMEFLHKGGLLKFQKAVMMRQMRFQMRRTAEFRMQSTPTSTINSSRWKVACRTSSHARLQLPWPLVRHSRRPCME